jgi:polyisoprenoid-binding protein YceI
VTVLILAAARLLWRLGHPSPALPPAMPQWEKRAAHGSHVLLYVLFFAAPLTGWLFSSASGFQTVYLGLFPIPDLLHKDKALADALRLAHKSINYTMAALIVIHAAAALKHHFRDRDDVLRRMLPLMLLCVSLSPVLAAGSANAQTPEKIVRERSQIRFAATQMNVPVEGEFRRFDGSVTFDPGKPEATKAQFTVELGSIDLHSEEGETEVKRKLWLDIAAFPSATFVTTSVRTVGKEHYEATGNLTIKGTSHEVVAPFAVTDANQLRRVDGQFTLKRLQFRIGEGEWSDTATVADDVLVRFRFTIPIR